MTKADKKYLAEKKENERLKKCERCRDQFPASRVYLVRDTWMCEPCGKKEISRWSELVAALCLALALVGLCGCSDGEETASATGATRCTITVNGEERPCSNR